MIRPVEAADDDSLWRLLEPVIRAGETYGLPRDMERSAALAWWRAPANEVFVAAAGGEIVGTGFLRPNAQGGGSHVANCGYVAAGRRGAGRALALHSIARARVRGFSAMQYNFVVSTNERAVGLWLSLGFEIVGRLPRAFQHPARGPVDVYVMYLSPL